MKKRGRMVTLFFWVIGCFLVFQLASAVYDRWAQDEEARRGKRVAEAANQLTEQWAQEAIQKAIVERRIVRGMSINQARQSRGLPSSIFEGADVNEKLRRQGVVQIWYWRDYAEQNASAGIDQSGRVVAVGEFPF